ncbi:hypothetical protein IPA_09080 [Ignicoccus pacificus DSM 13166]|uniref:Fido domain-containing protein n=1 Tax=Ignicoccus pacificus DSM 13166 TaxID=940294 RepID=A0A977KC33_9CREN|nr:hypothetical protein IPA_09080 [Ignicoccus pacificus DSM 13166]
MHKDFGGVRDVYLPTVNDLKTSIEIIKEHTEDPVELMSEEKLEQVVESAHFLASLLQREGIGEDEMVLLVAAKMFYEIILLHPLTDGNKRFATLVYLTMLKVNNLLFEFHELIGEMVLEIAVRLASNPRDWNDVSKYFIELGKAVKSYSKSLEGFPL